MWCTHYYDRFPGSNVLPLACLWFYDGKLVYPTVWPKRSLCSSKYGGHFRTVCFGMLPFAVAFSDIPGVGRSTQEGIHRIHDSSTPPRPFHAVGVSTRGPSSPFPRLQDFDEQVTAVTPCMRVYHPAHGCWLALLRHFPPNQHHRQLRLPYDCHYFLGLVRFALRILRYRCCWRTHANVWKLHPRPFHGRSLEPSHRNCRLQNRHQTLQILPVWALANVSPVAV